MEEYELNKKLWWIKQALLQIPEVKKWNNVESANGNLEKGIISEEDYIKLLEKDQTPRTEWKI